MLMSKFLARKSETSKPEYQRFVRQLYHACIARIFAPLKHSMTVPDIICCPDGHFRRVIYSIGPYIADYPEQVWLSGIVQGWCPRYKNCIFNCLFQLQLLNFTFFQDVKHVLNAWIKMRRIPDDAAMSAQIFSWIFTSQNRASFGIHMAFALMLL